MYSRVQIEDIYLTEDGTSGSRSCRVDIPNLSGLRPSKRATAIQAIGTPQIQLFNNLIGEFIVISPLVLSTTTFEALVTLINTSQTNKTTLTVKIDSDQGDFDLECAYSGMTNPTESSDSRITGLQITFIVVSINEEE